MTCLAWGLAHKYPQEVMKETKKMEAPVMMVMVMTLITITPLHLSNLQHA